MLVLRSAGQRRPGAQTAACWAKLPCVVFLSLSSLVWLLGRILISGGSGLWPTRDAMRAFKYWRRVTCEANGRRNTEPEDGATSHNSTQVNTLNMKSESSPCVQCFTVTPEVLLMFLINIYVGFYFTNLHFLSRGFDTLPYLRLFPRKSWQFLFSKSQIWSHNFCRIINFTFFTLSFFLKITI